MNCTFIDENNFIASGFDKVPYHYQNSGSGWKLVKCLDDGLSKIKVAKITGNSFVDKRIYFNADIKLGSLIEMKEKDTKHQNYINCLKPF